MPGIDIPTEAVDRIARSVGPTVSLVRVDDDVVGPPDPNRDLSYRLHQSLRWYYVARERRSDADKRSQVRRLMAISKTGSKLRNLLKPDQDWEWLKQFEFKILPDEIGNMLMRAEAAICDLEMKIEYGDDYDTEYLEGRDLRDLIRKRSPFEWLAGAYLADDYRVCFGKQPTLNRATDGTLGGPYIRFVEQVLVEFDVKNGRRRYSREAIANALTDVRKGRYRASPT
jgi:hypothetical protein